MTVTEHFIDLACQGLHGSALIPSGDLPVQPHFQKYSRFLPTQITGLFRAVPSRERGVSRSSRTLGWDAVDAAASSRKGIAGQANACEHSTGAWTNGAASGFAKTSVDVHMPLKSLGESGSRTAKPCGPGTRCWCQVGGGARAQPGIDTIDPPMTVTRRIRRRGEHGISR
jgi:hypothetical protein